MKLTAAGIGWPHACGIVAVLAIGLAADTAADVVGQLAIGLGFFAVVIALFERVPRDERIGILACLLFATIAEVCCSLVWGLYTYRLENIPLYVPPGHVMLFLLAIVVSRRVSDRVADAILAGAGLYTLAAAAVGFDTFGIPLFLVIVVLRLRLPDHRRLYAASFVVSLALELYGTWLGDWVWAPRVPGLGYVTSNPPGLVGAFYCTLDALVSLARHGLTSRARRRALVEAAEV